MQLSKLLLILCAVLASPIAMADPAPEDAAAATPSLAELHAACDDDIKKLCPGVQPGGGRILACLKQHQDSVSALCKQTVVRAVHAAGQGST